MLITCKLVFRCSGTLQSHTSWEPRIAVQAGVVGQKAGQCLMRRHIHANGFLECCYDSMERPMCFSRMGELTFIFVVDLAGCSWPSPRRATSSAGRMVYDLCGWVN
jgi:hypothetical protein